MDETPSNSIQQPKLFMELIVKTILSNDKEFLFFFSGQVKLDSWLSSTLQFETIQAEHTICGGSFDNKRAIFFNKFRAP
jgi:hypothetical protein